MGPWNRNKTQDAVVGMDLGLKFAGRQPGLLSRELELGTFVGVSIREFGLWRCRFSMHARGFTSWGPDMAV